MAYRIRDWNELFENNRTRDMKRMEWVPIPNKMDGLGYTELVDHPDGAAHFGAWIAIVEIASRSVPRGTLSRDRALSPQDLARISHLPAAVFEATIPRLIKIGWLESFQEVTEIPHLPAEIPHDPAPRASRARTEGNGTEGNGTEGNGTELSVRAALRTGDLPSGGFDAWWTLWSAVRGTNHRANAEQVFPRTVTESMETDCMHCTASYLQSLSDPSRGFNPENFLIDQARDKFKARWPARAAPNGHGRKPSLSERTMALWEKRLAEGKSPL